MTSERLMQNGPSSSTSPLVRVTPLTTRRAQWIERYRGHFGDGWDRWREETLARQLQLGVVPPGTTLSPRPAWVPAWDSLGERERALAERFMECFAAFLVVHRRADWSSAVLRRRRPRRTRDDTVVIVVSDNGASSEGGRDGTINEGRLSNFEAAGIGEMYRRIDEIGGPTSHNNYPWGWTMAGNTPFKRWKREVHEGGVADPCIVRLPSGIGTSATGEVSRQFAHAIDVLPTVLELVGVGVPKQLDDVPSPISTARASATSRARWSGRIAGASRHSTLRNAWFSCDLSPRLEGCDVSPRWARLRRRVVRGRSV